MTAPVLLLVALALVLGGCGDDEEPAAGDPRPVETVEPPPQLPRGWVAHRNRAGGFALGVAPGWTARDKGGRSLFRSPDRLVALSVSADRTDEALELDPRTFAIRAVEAVPGFEGGLEPGEPRRFQHPYSAVEVEATGTGSGIVQDVTLVVLRRDEIAVLTALVAVNAELDAGTGPRTALRMIRTLRSLPIGAPSAG